MDILDLPDDLKQRLRDGIVDFLAHQAEKAFGEDKIARIIRQLSSQATFSNSFDHAMESAVKRFIAEYTTVDEDLVESIISDGTFWQARDVREALMTMINRPGSWLVDERETVIQHFADVLPKRINRERVDKAIAFFLRCVLEELWTLPGVGEIREIYSLQFQKIGAEAARQQVALLAAQLQATTQLSVARMASGETFDQVLRWLGNATGDLSEYCVKGQIDMARQHDPNAWKLLLACSLFDQDARASREALGFTADLSLADRDDGLTMLQRLSLLNRDENDRFWLLPMVQGYAGAELVRAGCGDALTEQWFAWLLKFVQQNGINLDLHVEKAQMIAFEYPHLLSAIRWCREHERWEMVLQLAEGTWFYLYLVGLFGELREILEAALQAARALGAERQEGQFLRRLGVSFWVQEQYETALVKYFERANEIAIQYKDDIELGRVSHSRSDILYKKGYVREAEKLVKTMLETGVQRNYLKLKALAAYRLSEFESKKQRFDKALAWLDQSEKWSRELGWSRGLAWILYRRGITLIQQGNISSAEPFLMESLNMATSWSERHLMAYDKYRLAQVYLYINRLQLARQMAEEARDLYERLGMSERLAEMEELLQAFSGENAN